MKPLKFCNFLERDDDLHSLSNNHRSELSNHTDTRNKSYYIIEHPGRDIRNESQANISFYGHNRISIEPPNSYLDRISQSPLRDENLIKNSCSHKNFENLQNQELYFANIKDRLQNCPYPLTGRFAKLTPDDYVEMIKFLFQERISDLSNYRFSAQNVKLSNEDDKSYHYEITKIILWNQQKLYLKKLKTLSIGSTAQIFCNYCPNSKIIHVSHFLDPHNFEIAPNSLLLIEDCCNLTIAKGLAALNANLECLECFVKRRRDYLFDDYRYNIEFLNAWKTHPFEKITLILVVKGCSDCLWDFMNQKSEIKELFESELPGINLNGIEIDFYLIYIPDWVDRKFVGLLEVAKSIDIVKQKKAREGFLDYLGAEVLLRENESKIEETIVKFCKYSKIIF